MVVLHSYEETGSNGATGAQSNFLLFCLKDVLYRLLVSANQHTQVLSSSVVIAADVTALYDANFPSVHDRM